MVKVFYKSDVNKSQTIDNFLKIFESSRYYKYIRNVPIKDQ